MIEITKDINQKLGPLFNFLGIRSPKDPRNRKHYFRKKMRMLNKTRVHFNLEKEPKGREYTPEGVKRPPLRTAKVRF